MKKIKITNRYLVIIFISVLLGTILSVAWYNNLKKVALPEEKVNVLVFSNQLDENQQLYENTINNNVESIKVPISLVPINTIQDIDSIYGKTLIENVRKGDYIVTDMLTERGDTTFNAEEYFQVSIDVSELTNFLGLQLKRGAKYELYFRDRQKDELTAIRKYGLISEEVFIVDLVDHLGNKVFEKRDETIKSVILAIEDPAAKEKVVELKEDVYFELTKAPTIKKDLTNYNVVIFDDEAFINEILREKQDRRRYM